MRLFLLRHGQTAWNSEKRAQGHCDTELDETGIAQADSIAAFLSTREVGTVHTSDLRRCLQTAERVAAACSAPLIKTPLLRERNFGSLEGRPYDEVRTAIQQKAVQIGCSNFDARPEGGESFQDVWHRLDPFVASLGQEGQVQTVVSHGGTIGLLIAKLIEAGPASARNFRISNCSLTELQRREDNSWTLVRLNDCSHLEKTDEGLGIGA